MDSLIQLAEIKKYNTPFPHIVVGKIFEDKFANLVYKWLKKFKGWNYVETNFYSQFEFSLFDHNLPESISLITSNQFVNQISTLFSSVFHINELNIVDITAHKLIDGQCIGIHNDYIGEQETHRFVLNFNPSWKEENGGLFAIFNTEDANSIEKVIYPINNSGIGFEISKNSFHAITKIYKNERFSIVFTFN